jgi:hypothetical protein
MLKPSTLFLANRGLDNGVKFSYRLIVWDKVAVILVLCDDRRCGYHSWVHSFFMVKIEYTSSGSRFLNLYPLIKSVR